MMSAPLAARADIMSRMQSSIQLQTNSAATQVSRIGSTYAVSGSGVTMDVGGGNSADGNVGGLRGRLRVGSYGTYDPVTGKKQG